MAEYEKLNVLQTEKIFWSPPATVVQRQRLPWAPQWMWGFSVDIGASLAGAAKSFLLFFENEKGKKSVQKYSCHTSLDMPQHSKWSSLLYLAPAISYQGKLWFLSMPFFWFYDLLKQISREVPHLRVFLHNQTFNVFKQFEGGIPD